MLDYQIVIDPQTGEEFIETNLRGKNLLTASLLNKGTAFSEEERHTLGLMGKLPPGIDTLESQIKRTLQQYFRYTKDMEKNIYLNNLHDKNEVLFYKLVSENLSEMMPMIYTPMVGVAVKKFSHEFRQPRGLYISYHDRNYMKQIFANRTHRRVDVIVVTDGERVLGLGDQGVGAMDIPISKLKIYTLCAGINPHCALPIMLDVGTDNEELLNDPLYLGLRQKRIRGQAYDDFIDQFVTFIKKKFPQAFLHWEDFGRDNARRILERYRDTLCTFNDDMQGTAVVTLAALLSAVSRLKEKLSDQRIVIFGAGTAGVGIADQIFDTLVRQGLSREKARGCFWLIDREGLLAEGMKLADFQKPYARPANEGGGASLVQVMEKVHPTILIGCSAQTGAFTEDVVRTMARHREFPIILPLSNPNEKAEAHPENLLKWTEGKALIATGSPFGTVRYDNQDIEIAQCNNALSFPGIGLGVIASKASKMSDEMLWVACRALSDFSLQSDQKYKPLLPALGHAADVARRIAIAVAEQAFKEGVACALHDVSEIQKAIEALYWKPYYRKIRPKPPEIT